MESHQLFALQYYNCYRLNSHRQEQVQAVFLQSEFLKLHLQCSLELPPHCTQVLQD